MNNSARPEDPALFLKEIQRRDFLAFLDRAWPYISGGQILSRNWHVDAMACRLDRVRAGTSRRLLINLPPRNAKSKTVSIAWVAWMLGQDPSLNFVCVSYSKELSGNLARDCLTIIQSSWYRELFPRTVIRRAAAEDFQTSAGGGRLATSVTGSLTGRGGDIIILDDVIKPDEAASEVVREAVNNWYRSTLASRLNDKESGAIICVMQRLHQFDLPGMLLEAGSWDHLSLPAIAMEDEIIPLTRGRVHVRRCGDVLHPERESRETLERQRAQMGSYAFAAQYQQAPVPAEGNIFKVAWLKSYDDLDLAAGGEIVQSWDTGIKTAEGNSFSVGITALVRQRSIYIIDVWRGRLEFPDLKKKVVELALMHRVQTLLIEDKALGEPLIQALRSESLPPGVPFPIPCQPHNDKRTRAEGVSSMVEAGQVLLPREAHWLGEFKSELLSFPSGRYDDQVDALSQLLARVRQGWTDPVPIIAWPMLYDEDEGWIGDDNLNLDIDPDFDPWGG